MRKKPELDHINESRILDDICVIERRVKSLIDNPLIKPDDVLELIDIKQHLNEVFERIYGN